MRGDVLGIEAGHARCGELDREWKPVHAPADLSKESASALGIERSTRTPTRALSEQLNCGARHDLFEARLRSHYGQWSESVGHLAVDPQGLAAGRENS